mmetsp:Transcript_4163/g.5458  ORF Transcript_4163/g.5458 Transcript_4163/m.5458 type:complete len:388 (-) Transcript_4163:395-1558(-)|eukprot:CAMPEP_0198154100 /NCGR_PEP_ID=MMETSP1443-20131203/67285_1 /TAXON_ID=186043 /ORGANISM="Entomoneis sp., Strain CCMP2396" /LENGTH=387 /DNA_ID=CAMNT_0043820689 /DNA_START=83 /DNA_END=1246 /DNA_ORIENTATION=-
MRLIHSLIVFWTFSVPLVRATEIDRLAPETAETAALEDAAVDALEEIQEEVGLVEDELLNEDADVENINEIEEDRNGSSAPSSSKRPWGAAPSSSSENAATEQEENETAEGASHSAPAQHFSFSMRKNSEYTPPEGFVISARVYIDPSDKLAHLDEDTVTLPYWDCGITGSTTSPLPVKDATFRHSLTPTTPWAGTDGKHPLLAVALSPLTIETNSGESKQIQAGQVILLEDVLLAGHKLLPMPNHALQVLFLTLPQTHYHPGKDRVSLHKSTNGRSSIHPCPVPDDNAPQGRKQQNFLTSRILSRGILGMIGLSLSTLAADFFSKTAPLWLAVGVGGTCFVAGGTALAVLAGETAITNMEVMFEQRRLATIVNPPSASSNVTEKED